MVTARQLLRLILAFLVCHRRPRYVGGSWMCINYSSLMRV